MQQPQHEQQTRAQRADNARRAREFAALCMAAMEARGIIFAR